MAIYDKLRGKRAEGSVDCTALSVSNPYKFGNGGFVKVVSAGTIAVICQDGTPFTYTATAGELVDWLIIKEIVGGTSTEVIAIHLAG